MSRPRILLDESLGKAVLLGLRRRSPDMDVLRVGEPDAPSFGTKDPPLLDQCERMNRILISIDRKTMPTHAMDHLAQGKHLPGVILLPEGLSMGWYIREILLFWGASEHEEWLDLLNYLP